MAVPTATLQSLRHRRPRTPDAVRDWVRGYTGVTLASNHVCREHTPPAAILADKLLCRPPITLTHGPRGGGKSFGEALRAHMDCRFNPKFGVKILGGSLAQSRQVYNALDETVWKGRGVLGTDSPEIADLLKQSCQYHNGSQVEILPASRLSVRGPHVPSLVLDEIDELDDELRQAAMGMAMKRHGTEATVNMLSTWHKIGGPMAEMIGRADAGEFPLYRFCAFDVLETCDAKRSGPATDGPELFERCPQCPIKKWCHAEVVDGLPKAKRANGHYSIQSLIDKVSTVSLRTLESDYLCLGPVAHGLWFTRFDSVLNVGNVTDRIDFDSRVPLRLSIDSGVWQGAVFSQHVRRPGPDGRVRDFVHILDEYLSEDEGAELCAQSCRQVARMRFGDRINVVTTDSAGGAKTSIGPKVIAEYERGGLRGMSYWPKYPGSVFDSLTLLDSFVCAADGVRTLLIHARCKRLIEAFQSYRRKRVGGIWLDRPEDPQHPHEDLIDAVRGDLMHAFPQGRDRQTNLRETTAHYFN